MKDTWGMLLGVDVVFDWQLGAKAKEQNSDFNVFIVKEEAEAQQEMLVSLTRLSVALLYAG